MDYLDDDAVSRFEMWEAALIELALDDLTALGAQFLSLQGDGSIIRMKREAIINAARIEGDAHLARVGKAFPGVDVPALVQALRVKVVELRLEGGI